MSAVNEPLVADCFPSEYDYDTQRPACSVEQLDYSSDSSDSEEETECRLDTRSLDHITRDQELHEVDEVSEVQDVDRQSLYTMLTFLQDEPDNKYDWCDDNLIRKIPDFAPPYERPGSPVGNALNNAIEYFQLFYSDAFLEKVRVL